MAKSLTNWGRYRYQLESTFNVDPGNWAASGVVLQLREPPDLSGLKEPAIDPGIWRAGMYEESVLRGHKSDSTLSLSYYLHGWSTDTTPATGSATMHPDAEVLAQALGLGVVFGANTFPVASAVAVDKITITVDTTANCESGMGCMLATGAGWECGVIKEVTDATTLVLRSELQNTTLQTDKNVYLQTTIVPVTTGLWGHNSMAGNILGQLSTQDIITTGMRASNVKLSLNPRDYASATIDYMVNGFTHNATLGAPTYTAYSYPERQQIVGGVLRVETGSTVTEIDCNACDIDFGMEVIPQANPNGSQGTEDPVVVMHRPRLTLNPAYQNQSWRTAFQAGTSYDIIYQFGTDPGRTIFVSFPRAELVEDPVTADSDGVQRSSLVFAPMRYSGDTSSSGTTENKDWCLCFV